ncbi:MAG: winged helix-turn-helix transcriptional regulator [Cellulosilyticaceae bacterium]
MEKIIVNCEIEADQLITRTCYAEVPPRVEYSITEKGLSLFPLLEMMCEWGEKNIDERFELINAQYD